MKLLDKLKNLKLRRWGDTEYTDAKQGGSGGGSSKEVTIDDVVKFIHDNTADFPYTTYDEIPEFGIPAETPSGVYRTDSIVNATSKNATIILYVPVSPTETYIIMAYQQTGTIG